MRNKSSNDLISRVESTLVAEINKLPNSVDLLVGWLLHQKLTEPEARSFLGSLVRETALISPMTTPLDLALV